MSESRYEPRETEVSEQCCAPWPGGKTLQCVYPARHDTHWDGALDLWLTTPVGYPQEIAAAELRGAEQERARLIAALRDEDQMNAWFKARSDRQLADTGKAPWPPEAYPPSREYADYLASLPLPDEESK